MQHLAPVLPIKALEQDETTALDQTGEDSEPHCDQKQNAES